MSGMAAKAAAFVADNDRLLQARRDRCPNRANHVDDEPRGYQAWHSWARAKAATHRQLRCPGCELWLIWQPIEMKG